jgi:hypothetical protein
MGLDRRPAIALAAISGNAEDEPAQNGTAYNAANSEARLRVCRALRY